MTETPEERIATALERIAESQERIQTAVEKIAACVKGESGYERLRITER